MRVNEVIIVEGKNDTAKVKLAVEADTIETKGSAISKETLKMIKHANEKRGVIVLTDPDYPGNRIRRIITEYVPSCKHAFLPKEEALPSSPNKNVGIENASVESILKALQNVQQSQETLSMISDIEKLDLIHHKLIGHPDAKKRRELLGKQLHIGMTNGKQLLKRLHMFQISKRKLDEAMLYIKRKRDLDNESTIYCNTETNE